MQQEEYTDKGIRYVRIDKRKARIKFGEDKTIYLFPDMMRLENAWLSLYSIISKASTIMTGHEFDNYVNHYAYYNCDSKRGRGIKYFIDINDL